MTAARTSHSVFRALAAPCGVLGLLLFGVAALAQPRPRRPPGSRVRDAGVDVQLPAPTRGRVAPLDVQRALAPLSTPIQACYQQGLRRDPLLHGEVTLRIRIEPDGSVGDVGASAEGAPPAMYGVARCIGELVRAVRFTPPEGGAATVTVPYVFQSTE
ncbi:MAG: AgmX/PglI C-terminal domain-containing protein [Myxococcales bacterium]|nr:AgmX/PglI C-terminal domain-containing protein [Myxococcales bacterium]